MPSRPWPLTLKTWRAGVMPSNVTAGETLEEANACNAYAMVDILRNQGITEGGVQTPSGTLYVFSTSDARRDMIMSMVQFGMVIFDYQPV